MSHQDQRWVIVFLIYADFRTNDSFSMDEATKIEINAMLEDIMTCSLNKRAALYVILDSIQYVTKKEHEGYQIEDRVLFYEILPSPGYPLNKFGIFIPIERKTSSTTDPTDLGHSFQRPEKLKKILKENIPLRPSDEVMLITWDHGSAFGVFRQLGDDISVPEIPMPIDNQLDKYPFLKLFWDRAKEEKDFTAFLQRKSTQPSFTNIKVGNALYTIRPSDKMENSLVDFLKGQETLYQFIVKKNQAGESILSSQQPTDHQAFSAFRLGAPKVNEILQNRELSEVIEDWLGERENKKVGVLLMMNCWLMNLHSLFSLKDKVKFLVAPQGNIDNPGYNYRDILLSIYNGRPLPLTAEEVSRNCVVLSHNPFFFKRAALLNPCNKDTIDFRTIINVRLDYPTSTSPFDTLIDGFKDFIDQLITLLDSDTDKRLAHLMDDVRRLSFEFTVEGGVEIVMVDLPNYLINLSFAHLRAGPLLTAMINALSTFRTKLFGTIPIVQPMFIGEKCYFVRDKIVSGRLTGTSPTGYSIYFPTVATNNQDLLNNINEDELLKGPLSNWKTLLRKIYGPII